MGLQSRGAAGRGHISPWGKWGMDGVVPGVVGQLFGEVVLPLIAPAVCCPELGLARGGSWLAPIPQTLSDRAWQ